MPMEPRSFAALAAAPLLMIAAQEDSSPKEFGDVTWGSKLEVAQKAAQASKKPIMLLFQEVPG